MINKSKTRLQALDENSIGYSKLLYDSSQDYTKLVNESANSKKALTDTIVESYGLQNQLNTLLKESNVYADLQLENESRRFDLVQKINQELDPAQRNKLEDDLLSSMQEGLDLELEIFRNKKDIDKVNKSIQTNSYNQINLEEKLDELTADRVKTEKALAFQTAINNDNTGKLKNTFELLNKITNDQITGQGSLASSMQEVEASAFNVGTEQYRQIDLTDEINERLSEQRNLENARTTILDTNNDLTAQQRMDALALVEANIQTNKAQLAQYQALQTVSEGYQSLNDKAEGLRDTMMAPVDKLFGIVPSGLSKMLGLDKIQSEMKDKLFKSIADGFMGAGGGVSGFFSAASAGASTLMASLLPILPLLLAIAGVVALVKLFMDADKQVSELAHNLNVSYKEAGKLQNSAVDIAAEMDLVGMNAADVTKQMVDLQTATGMNIGKMALTNEKAKGLLETSTMLTTQFGLTADETIGLNSAAAITGTTLENISLQAQALGEDGLVPAQEIMKEIAKTSKSTLMNFSKNPKALALAVKQAKLMGVTLDQVAIAGDKLMEIESSVTAENKARLILGRDINMNAARYYAMTGQTEKQMAEMKKQAGTLANYEKMGPIQKRALADALGISNDELAGMMAKEKELRSMGIDEKKLNEILAKDKDGQLDLQSTLNGLKDDEARKMLKAKLAEQQRAGIQEKLGSTIQKVTDLLYKMVEPILPIIDEFVDSLGDGSGTLKSMSKVFGVIGSVLGTIMEISMAILKGAWMPIGIAIDGISFVFSKISKLVKYIKTDIFGIKDATGEAGKAAEGTSMSMEVIKGIATTIGVIIGGWFLLKGLGKAKDGLSSMYDSAKGIGSSLKDGFKSIKDTYSSTKDMGKDLIEGAKGFKDNMKQAGDEGKGIFGKLKAGFQGLVKKKSPVEEVTDKAKTDVDKVETPEVDTKGAEKSVKNTKSFADKLKSAFKSINDTLKSIFKGIGDMLKNIFTFIKDTVKTILDFIKNVMKDIFKTIKDVAKELTSTLRSLMQNIGELLNSAINVIKDVGTNLIGAVGDLLGSVIEVIDSQGTALVEALGNIGNALAENVMKIVNTLLDGLGQAASSLPGIMGSLGKAIGSFFSGMSAGLVTFANAMAAPTILFGLPVGLIVLAMAMGIAAALRIAGPGIAALGVMFEGLGKGIGAAAPAIEAAGSAISSILGGIGDIIESVGNAIAKVITAIADSIVSISKIDGKNLAKVGLALSALGVGLIALTAGEVVNGIASFFGASPVDTLKELETIDGNKMKVTGDGLTAMADSLKNFGGIDTAPISAAADALDKFNNQVLKGGLADALNNFLGSDPFAVFTQLAAIDTGKIDTVAKSIALAGTSIESFNQKMASLDDSVADKGDIITALLNDIADVEYSEIDSLASAIDNLSKSYDSLLASMKNITDDDISRMQQIASATPKDVGGGGIGDTLSSAMSGVKDLASNAISSVGSFFGFGEDDPVQETQSTTVATTPITPVMQPVASVNTQPIVQTNQTINTDNTQPNFKNVEALLKELISKVEQPVVLKIGEKAISEMQSVMSLKKSYSSNVNGYRA